MTALLVLQGLCLGLVAGAAQSAVLLLLDVIPKIMAKTNAHNHTRALYLSLLLGALFGCAVTLFGLRLSLGTIAAACAGVLFGLFAGAVLAALSEVLDVFSSSLKSISFSRAIILSFVCGKLVGSVWYWLTDTFLK